MQFLEQLATLARFNLATIPERKGASAAAVFGIAGVVAVLVAVLSIAAGFQRVMERSGGADTAIVLRSGADTEMTSGLSREQTRIIADTAIAFVHSVPPDGLTATLPPMSNSPLRSMAMEPPSGASPAASIA